MHMVIEMLKTRKDGNITIWNKGDVYKVKNTTNNYYEIKEIDGQMYGIGKDEKNEFRILKPEKENKWYGN